MKYMKPTMFVFTILIIIFAIIASMQVFFRWKWPADSVGVTIFVFTVFIVFIAITIIGLVGQKFNIKKIGFYLLHLGLIFFLVGSMIFRTTGEYESASLSIDDTALYKSIQREDGTILRFNFSFGITKLAITNYEPVYDIYEVVNGDSKVIKQDIELSSDGYYDFGKYGKKHIDDLLIGNNGIQEKIQLANNIFAYVRMPVKKYEATMIFNKDGKDYVKPLIINEPIRFDGYKIYLMSYNSTLKTVKITFKKDYGEVLSTSGIFITIAGTLYHCLVYPVLLRKEQEARINKKEVEAK